MQGTGPRQTPMLSIILLLLHPMLCSAVSSTQCPSGSFHCQRAASSSLAVCIPDHLVCDGRLHCPSGDDESLELCKSRRCSPSSQFACASPGRCLPLSMRCDGSFDCEQSGLGDFSDETDCPANSTAACSASEFSCRRTGACVSRSFVCDRFKDCPDGSDETDCPADACNLDSGEFTCITDARRCLKASAKCDGVHDCADGSDEIDCGRGSCEFHSEFQCRLSGTHCIAAVFVCDGQPDCSMGEDEVCAIDNALCSTDAYWTCKSGAHCVRAEHVCDGRVHCPDASDERGCPAASSAASASPAPSLVASPGPSSSPSPPDPCAENFGTCDQLCLPASNASSPVPPASSGEAGGFTCACLPGYRLQPEPPGAPRPRSCRAVGAARLLLATETGIYAMDMESGTVAKIPSPGLDLKLPKLVDFDSSSGRVFFHTRDGIVGSLSLNGMGNPAVLARHLALGGLALDWSRQLLFYTVPEAADEAGGGSGGHVGVMDAGTGRRTPLRKLSCPRGLALDPMAGLVYVSLWCGPQPGIYSLRMDGGGGAPRAVVTRGVKAPGHLALDSGRLYWFDVGLRGLFSCSAADGSDLRSIWHAGAHFDGLPMGLTVFESLALWPDLRARSVLSVDRGFGAPLRVVSRVPGNSTALLSAALYHSARQPRPFGSPGPCTCPGSHICVAPSSSSSSPAGWDQRSCLCDFQHVMSNGVCQPVIATVAIATASVTPVPVNTEAANADTAASAAATAVAAAVAATLAIAVLGGGVAVCCLRRGTQGSSSGGLRLPAWLRVAKDACVARRGGGGGGRGPPAAAGAAGVGDRIHRMMKIDSRTPLTDCEIDLGGENSC